jgi:multidrug efflux pump subunit AcrA (membrane-fusion protein)
MQTKLPGRRGSIASASSILVMLTILGTAVGGTWWWVKRPAVRGDTDAILHTVQRDKFVLAVTERGEIESSGVTEIRSEVKTKNTAGVGILRIVPEGTVVEEGDFLAALDSSALDAERTTQQIAFNNAEALVVEAKNLYDTALIAKKEYTDGTFVQLKQTAESAIFVAEENLNRAKEYFEYSKKLAAKGYVNQLQLQADKFAVDKCQKELDAAKTALMVLEEFTLPKMVTQLESDILINKAKWEAQKSSYKLESTKLKEIEDQIAKCTIRAPRAGTVKYAHMRDRRGQDDFIVEPGAVIRELQAIIYLPDPASMEVEMTINESLIQYVKKGMSAVIRPIGLGDITLQGTVNRVNQYAEPGGWRKANVKEYKAYVSIDQPLAELRSGMTASVTIEAAYLPNALQVPVQAVYAHGKEFYCFVYNDGDWELRPVVCGPTNDKFFVVESGLQENDRVALSPRRYLQYVSLPELPPEENQRAVRRGPLASEESVAQETPSASPPTAEVQTTHETSSAGG